MKKCVICHNDIVNEDPAVLFDSIEGITNEICSNCEKQVDIMEGSENIKEAKSAVNYLYTCYLINEDEHVRQVLKNLLDINSKELIIKEKEQASKNPVDTTKVVDYFSDNISIESNDINKWISVLNVTTLIYVILILIVSITINPLIFFIAIFGVLMFVALIKIIINMSEEVTDIKRMLINIKNK